MANFQETGIYPNKPVLMVKSLTIEVLEGWLFKASVHALSQEMLVQLILVIESSKLLLLVLMVFERVSLLLEAIRESLLVRVSTLGELKQILKR